MNINQCSRVFKDNHNSDKVYRENKMKYIAPCDTVEHSVKYTGYCRNPAGMELPKSSRTCCESRGKTYDAPHAYGYSNASVINVESDLKYNDLSYVARSERTLPSISKNHTQQDIYSFNNVSHAPQIRSSRVIVRNSANQ